ncbi:MAG: 4Fe-4S dicluster domain-containing protein [Gemmatimonadota bacterium]
MNPTAASAAPTQAPVQRWAKVIDHTRCIGCHACSTACKSENLVPLSVNRTYVKYVEVGEFPQVRRSFQVTRCNQCDDPPCVHACPTAAMFRRTDGIVDFDKAACIGCKACIAACPYDAIFINPDDHSAEKCNFCAHRLDVGLEPACVVVCPTQAILVGDLEDAQSAVSQIVHREPVSVRRPEKETRPKLFYRGATQFTLDPLAAQRPDGGLFMWSQQPSGPHAVTSGHPGRHNSSAAALLAYDVAHSAPWDWRVSLYTWTKSIAAGAYLAPLLLAVSGLLGWTGSLWSWAAPLVGLVFLGLTGVLLIWDLEHPERFYLLFLRPQWKSWLVRGGFIITGYALVLVAHMAFGLTGRAPLIRMVAPLGGVLAVLTAIYTAFLFGQSRGRDLWQNPMLPVHLLAQAVMAGAGVLGLLAPAFGVWPLPALRWVFAIAAAGHLFLMVSDIWVGGATAHARLAHHELIRGHFAGFYWGGLLLSLVALAAPWLGMPSFIAGLVGLFLFEHGFVQAGQRVPLA